MPPKAKAKKQEPEDPQQKYQMLIGQIKSLEKLTLQRAQDNTQLKETLALLQTSAKTAFINAGKEKEDRLDISADSTRQFKAMQDELLKDIADRERGIETIRAQGAKDRIQLENEIREKEDIIQKRDQEIIDLQHRLDQLNKEFSAVLRQTLASVAEKIEQKGEVEG
ncbi:Conserved_hypothetical protein [Hexamita inflata]|uniref:Dynein regulatory complex protein 12 n=1 Tax=Hexamita inflata TaxID=28002 RepID=A0AA86PGD7_9EUKA|nr:Conserved hypothetical protein [Hexamita inflata]